MKIPPMIVVQLFHIKGAAPLGGKEQEFSEPSVLIGRHPSCHLRFPAELSHISRKHAEIIREGNQFKLIDHSTNGTFVNGKKVREVYLKDGDVLMFSEGGPQISFLTQMKEGIEVPLEAPPPPEGKPLSVSPPREETPEVSSPSSKAPLIIQYGPTIRSFKQLPITIGKSPKCEYPLDHPAISDQHAQIFFNQDQYWVKDLTGQNSIRINRQPIGLQTPLRPDDELALSPQGPLFRFFGEGRLGEIEGALDEKPMESPGKTREMAEGRGRKKIPSRLKKIFGA